MKIAKLIGGKSAFVESLETAYSGPKNAIVYCPDLGFYNAAPANVGNREPMGSPYLHGIVVVIVCNYNANDSGRRFVNASDYPEIRREILELLNA